MIEGVIGVNEMWVRDIMILCVQMVIIDIDQLVEEFLFVMFDSVYFRFFVINEDKDYIEGILLVKDLFCYVFINNDDQVFYL